MRLLSPSSYYQCRHTLLRAPTQSWGTLANLICRRHRSGGHSKANPRSARYQGSRRPANPPSYPQKDVEFSTSYNIPQVDPNNIPAFFEKQVKNWSRLGWLHPRLQSFGIPRQEVGILLNAFVRAVIAGELSTREGHEKYVLSRFVHHLDDDDRLHFIDVLYNNILFTWASDPKQFKRLSSAGVAEETIHRIQALAQAGDHWFPAEEFPDARKLDRKIIMHVGPTNSGKTHNALRALAAAKTGVYAGPLRLLAHEIWERLNRGQIVPAGVEELKKEMTTDTTALDMAVVHKQGNAKYARACNMRTGEEQRVVDEAAPLISCTVEMLNLRRLYDVAVIDEIQMIGDQERGNSWTTAVLGVCAKEVHLCGEETAVPVIQALLKDTGDELVVHRYERLSPLRVEEESLNGDWSKVKKGDCIVTFSRGKIFKLKRDIEKNTPFRCAVVYGRLPPEIRSEQAALFNDPNSGYDILIGSDAIGMGLNLKIRRIVFEDTSKYHGVREAPLSVSQTKQIAGRAGRYGLHGSDPPGGYVTSFLPEKIEHIKKALVALPQPLQAARIGISVRRFHDFSLALPPGASAKTIIEAFYYISRTPDYLRQEDKSSIRLAPICELIEMRKDGLTEHDTIMFILSPIPYRDTDAMEIVHKFLHAYQATMSVDLWECLGDSPLIANLDAVERLQTEGITKRVTSAMMKQLESLHRASVLYIWSSFRRPVSWHNIEEATALKDRLEKALDWGLQAITKSQSEQGLEQYAEYSRNEKEKDKLIYKARYEGRREREKQTPWRPGCHS